MISGEGPSRSLTVNAQLFLFTIYRMRLDLGYVVANVIEQSEFQFTWRKSESFLPGSTCQVHEYLSVGKSKIRG